MLGLMTDIH